MESSTEKNGSPTQAATSDHASSVTNTLDASESIAVREDQIQSAVAFLSHPKVRDSPTNSKRAFLEQKGLTAAEIDEAFSRVPQSAQTSLPAQPAAPAAAAAPAPYAASQPASTRGYKPFPQQQVLAVPNAAPSSLQLAAAQPQGLRWTQVVLGVGVTAAAVVAVQHYVYPYIADKYRKLTSKSREQLEAAQQREQQLLETIKELQANQKELQDHLKTFGGVVKSLKEDVESVRHSSSRGWYPGDTRNGPESSSPWLPPGDTYSNPRDHNNLRPNWTRYGEIQNASGYWASNGPANGGSQGFKRVVQEENWRATAAARTTANPSASEPARNPSYAEVVEMLQKGITPPNVRTDINDQPPDPSRPFSESRALPSAKPWQRNAGSVSSDSDVRPHTPPFPVPPTHSRSPAQAPPSYPPAGFPNNIPESSNLYTSSLGITSSTAAQNTTSAAVQNAISAAVQNGTSAAIQSGISAAVQNATSAAVQSGISAAVQDGTSSSSLNTVGMDAGRVSVPSVWRPPPSPAPTVSYKPAGSPTSAPAVGSGSSVEVVAAVAASSSVTEAIEAEVGTDV